LAGFYEHVEESSGFIKSWNVLTNYQLSKE